jgi:hypothetical protein
MTEGCKHLDLVCFSHLFVTMLSICSSLEVLYRRQTAHATCSATSFYNTVIHTVSTVDRLYAEHTARMKKTNILTKGLQL